LAEGKSLFPREKPSLQEKNPPWRRENPFAKAKIVRQGEKTPYPREKSSLGRLKTEKTRSRIDPGSKTI
jgi:hypothetical protein